MASITKIQGAYIPMSIDLYLLGGFTENSLKFELYDLSNSITATSYTYPSGGVTKNGTTYSFTIDTSALLGTYGIEMSWTKSSIPDKAQCGTITVIAEATT